MNNNEIEFYKKLAEEIQPKGFRCFLYVKDAYAWLYIITPNNSWLYIDNAEYGGYNIIYNYEPSKEFGSGCRYNDKPLYEITADILTKAEQYGKSYGHRRWMNVHNIYDGKHHRENIWKSPKHYINGYKSMLTHWNAKDLVEL